jgi:hypothetical protein
VDPGYHDLAGIDRELGAYLETLPGPIVPVAHSYRGLVITNAATLGGCQNADPRCRRTAVGSVIPVKVRDRRTTEPMEETE